MNRLGTMIRLTGVAVVACAVLLSWRGTLALAAGDAGMLPRVAVTDPGLATDNLNSQVSSLEKLIERHPERWDFKRQLFDLLLTRTQFFGTYTDLETLERLANAAPESADGVLLKARFRMTVHDFDGAAALLAGAVQPGPQRAETDKVQKQLRLARREGLEELLTGQRKVLEGDASYDNLILAAGIAADLGLFEEADGYFHKAIETYRDTSPFPLAFVFFQRGVMWGEKAGDDAKARRLYEEAVHYLPGYVVANVHLAELLASSGERERAVANLMSVSTAADPEPRGLLGELLMASDAEAAASHISSAASAYTALLDRYPLAFADHGSEFFAGPGGDPARGLALAKTNLANRRTERAYQVAIEAALAAKNTEEMCTLVSGASSISPVLVPLKELVAEHTGACAAGSAR